MERPGSSSTAYNILDMDEEELADSLSVADPVIPDRTSVIVRPRLSRREQHLDAISQRNDSSEGEMGLRRKESPSRLRKKHFMKPGRFDGTGSLESFLRQFEVCAKHNLWTQTEKADFLQCSLDKAATQLLWDYGSSADITYENLISRLRQRYGLESQAETFRTQLKCRRQKERESLADLLHDIRRLVTLAYPAPASEITEAIAIDAFLDSMADNELSLKVREREPGSLDAAFRTAVRLETYKKTLKDNESAEGHRRDSRRQVRATKQEDELAEMSAQMKDFFNVQRRSQEQWMLEQRRSQECMNAKQQDYDQRIKHIEEMLLSAQRNSIKPLPHESNPKFEQTMKSPTVTAQQQVGGSVVRNGADGRPRTVRCYNCQRLGHLSKHCRAPRKQEERTSSVNYNTTVRSAEIQSSQSLYVRCRINRNDCFGLLDTGSEINLIPASIVIDQPLSKTSRKLFAANGSEIRVQGEISINVHFNKNCRRNVTFVVSDQVKEMMLGMEFFTVNRCGLSFAKGKLFVGRCQLPVVRKNGTGWCRRIHVSNEVEIPPASQIDIPSKIIGEGEIPPETIWMLEHRELCPGMHTARMLIDGQKEETLIRLINTNAKSVKINDQEMVGVLCAVDLIEETKTVEIKAKSVESDSIDVLLASVDPEVPSEARTQLREMLQDFPDVFSQHKTDLGRCEVAQHRIDTGNARPVRQPLRSQPRVYREFIDETVEQMVKDELIEPAQSEWASNIVLVKKKDGTLRFCLDYRSLNAVTRGDAYPLPKINECLDSLEGARWFSTLDLTSGYHQIAMNPEDADKTTFVTRKGSFRWKRMPMGLCGATATFQRTMDLILSGLNFRTCLVYFDDVIVFSQSLEQHIQRLKEVFTRLRQAHLKLKVSKCRLMSKKVEFLGHVISGDGITVDPAKVEKVQNWPNPSNLKELRSFLGLCSYYRRFVPSYAAITDSLSELTRKGVKFEWNAARQQSMDKLKQALISAPILGLPNDDDEFIVDTDASEFAIGAVLSQRQKGIEVVLVYGSRLLSRAERNYCTTRRELLAVVYFLKHFKTYLLGRNLP